MAEERRSNDLKILTEITRIGVTMNNVEVRLGRLEGTMSGTNGNPGIKIRVDRLEQDKKRSNKYHMAWAGAVVSGAAAWAAKTFGGA